jgi:hypothetical protein
MADDIDALRAALEAAQRGQVDATARANAAETRVRAETTARFQAQEVALDTEITRSDEQAKSLQQRLTALQQEGDIAGASEVMRQMMGAEAHLAQLRTQKGALSQQKEIAERQAADPLASYLPAERDWIGRHQQYLTDAAYRDKVNASAGYATKVLGLVQGSPEYFKHIEDDLARQRGSSTNTSAQTTNTDPGHAAGGNANDGALSAEPGGGDGDSPFSSGGDLTSDGPPVVLQQQHTLEAPIVQATPERPAMSLDANPGTTEQNQQQQQQTRAIGRGGDGIRSIAAPPTRRVIEASARAMQNAGRGRIEPTMEELQMARTLAESIEPEMYMRGDDAEMVRWYYTNAHSPTHQKTRRRVWASQSVIG